MTRIRFVTGNKGKVREASRYLEPLGFRVDSTPLPIVEVQATDLRTVAEAKLAAARQALGVADHAPVLIDDGGLFVDALRDFPGVYSSHALSTIGVPGILNLLAGETNRRARFRAVLGYWDGARSRFFEGECRGTIAHEARVGDHGFGFDPIFIPDDGDGSTFSEIPAEEKNRFSHRGRALASLVDALRASRS